MNVRRKLGGIGTAIAATALVLATGCSLAVSSTAPEVVYMGKLKRSPVSDVVPSAVPAAYEAPDVLPPKEPAINVLARGGDRRGGS